MWNAECEMSGRRSCRERTPRAIPHSELRIPHLGSRPMALLELLAAAARARIVTADAGIGVAGEGGLWRAARRRPLQRGRLLDRKSTRLNSSHRTISYAVFCLKQNKL